MSPFKKRRILAICLQVLITIAFLLTTAWLIDNYFVLMVIGGLFGYTIDNTYCACLSIAWKLWPLRISEAKDIIDAERRANNPG